MNTALITTKVVKIPQVWSSLSDSQVLMKHQFQNNRRTTRTLPNSTVSTYNYDDSSRLTGIQTTLNQNTIDSLAYTLDNVGNRVSKTQNSAIVDYTYDNIYRLTNVSPTGTAQLPETYTYDAVGNRTTSGNDQFPQTNETVVYSYDDENRLTGVTITQGSNVKQLAFAYDPFGRRIKKTIVQDTIGTDCTSPNTCPRTTNYIYDGQSIIMEYDQNSNITAKYTHGPNIDEPLAVQQGTNIYYYHADGLGSITGLSNTSGSIVQTYSYDSFGNMTTTGSISQPFTYTAREYDSETGMYFYRARYYDPTVGRFVTKDPIGFAGGDVNLYAYVENNVVNFSDPLGLTTTTWDIYDVPWEELLETAAAAARACVFALPFLISGDSLCKKECPPCNPPVGTTGYRLDTDHYHAGLKPHVHLYKMNQNPNNCQCFWQPIGATSPPPPPGAVPL